MKNKKVILLFSILIISMLILPINNVSICNDDKNNIEEIPDDETSIETPLDLFNLSPEFSDVIFHSYELDVASWWNRTFRYRIGIEIENSTMDRYQPVDIFLAFRENEHYINSSRLVRYNYSGNDDWNVIPSQVWNITYWNSPINTYIKWCSITFMANISGTSNRTYFLYFNENLDGIEIPNYNTGFSSTRTGDKITVDIDPPSTDAASYNIIFEEGAGYHTLELDLKNVHSNESLRPEKNSAQLAFLGHFDEGSGNLAYDSSGKISSTTPMILYDGGSFSTGIKKFGDSGLYFDGKGIAEFPNGYILGDPGAGTDVGPFSDQGSYDWTITTWLYPTAYNDVAVSNHQTRNCWLSKASDTQNDNIEIGINYNAGQNDYFTHLYLQTDGGNTYKDFIATGANIKLNAWNFVALKYDGQAGIVRVYVDNGDPSSGVWVENSGTWSGEMDTDAAGSNFTLGATQHGSSSPGYETRDNNVNYTGYIDEVVVYNISLSDDEIINNKDNTYIATIEDITELSNGQVMAKYEVNWTQTWDMHISDVVTFYYDYSLWNIQRTIYFDSNYDTTCTNSYIANGKYNLSELNNWNLMGAVCDNTYCDDITDPDPVFPNPVENYTIVHDEDGVNTTVGFFIANFSKSKAAMTFEDVDGDVSWVDADKIFSWIPEFPSNFDNDGGGSTKYVFVDLWEYANLLTGLTRDEVTQVFNRTQLSLQTTIDIHVFQVDNFFYNLLVNVTDIDGKVVPGATVTIWNSTNDQIRENNTNSNGTFTFTRLLNDTYTVNVSYSEYGKGPLTVTSPKLVILNETSVDYTGLNITKFENVNLTSISLTCQREDGGVLYEYIDNANVTFHINTSSTYETIGSELTVDGKATFRWQNFTLPSDGTVMFDIEYLGDYRNLEVAGDLFLGDLKNVSLYFLEYQDVHVNVSLTDYSVTLTDEPVAQKILGETLDFAVNYAYYVGPGDEGPIDGASVYYYIKLGYQKISTQDIYLTFDQNGRYTTSIDTSTPPDITFNASTTYTMVVEASKPGYDPASAFITFSLSPYTATLTPSETELEVYWNEDLTVTVTYLNVFADPDDPINSAEVEYSVVQNSEITGNLSSLGSGQYKFELSSTEFIYHGNYDLQITANKQNYQQKTISIPIIINPINTLINNKISIVQPETIKVGTSKIFYFNYSTATPPAVGISNCSTSIYEWQLLDDDGSVIESNQSDLIEIGNGSYMLDFNTELKKIGSYTLVVSLGQTNYVERTAVISLVIVPRDINLTLPSDVFTNNIIEIVSGNPLNFTLYLADALTDEPLDNATVWISFLSVNYTFIPNGNGTYSINLVEAAGIQTMLLIETINSRIHITKTNYTFSSEGELITINVVPVSPLGIPILVWILISAVAVIFVGGYGTGKYIQYRRIPEFIKKLNKMKKAINSNKPISESLVTESKMEYMLNRLGDRWNKLGISLDDILEIKSKKLEEIKKESIVPQKEPLEPEKEYPEFEEEPSEPEKEYPEFEEEPSESEKEYPEFEEEPSEPEKEYPEFEEEPSEPEKEYPEFEEEPPEPEKEYPEDEKERPESENEYYKNQDRGDEE